MGTASEGSDGGFGGDFGVGAIVWVRRRNGSWWPGRVLGLEELAESHLMSPRSGTPVKLLGREDASVDWYNLEKSKRVKSFRCGEFDACIERAEASHILPIKKREKYARREDAILHALELEKQQLEMNQQNTAISCHESNKGLGISERESNNNSSEVHVPNKIANQKSQTSSSKIPSSLDECYLGHPSPVHRNRKVKLSIREQGKHEIVNLLEVEDVGPEVIKSMERLSFSVAGRNSEIPDENQDDLFPQAAGGKNFSDLKRKIVPGGTINDTPKRRDRRQPLLKVLQNSAKLSVSYSFWPHHDINVNPTPGVEDHIDIIHDTENYLSSDADDPLDYSRHSVICPLSNDVNDNHLQQPGCTSNESTPSAWTEENEFDSSATDSELGIVEEKLTSGITHPFNRTAGSSIESGMSHWHLKGKRNNRTIAKRLNESVGGKNLGDTDRSNVLLRETSCEGMATNYNMINFVSAVLNVSGEEFSCEKEPGCDIEEDELLGGLGNKRYDLERQHNDFVDSEDDLQLISQSGWGVLGPSCNIWRAYLKEPVNSVDQFYTPPFSRMMPMLVDVDLKVQIRYQREHVPLISLMSGLNGKAIVGHPVDIEILEDGSTDLLLPISDTSLNGDAAAPPIWRTAKRTSMHRLPRSNPDSPNYLHLERKYHFDIPLVKKKSNYHAHRSASGKFQKKPSKTINLSSSQKTRALSSFISEKMPDIGSGFLGGLIKSDGSMPSVTCVPVKVVFSRILESVGRTSSAVVHRDIAANAVKRDPP